MEQGNQSGTPGPVDDAVSRLAFLAAAGEVLASSLDYDQTLSHVAELAIPALGDLCIVDVVNEGRARRVATAHVLPEKVTLLDQLRQEFPPTEDSPSPAGRVLRSGKLEVLEVVTPAVVAAHTNASRHAELIIAIGVRSFIAVPLIARNQILGVISVGITESDRTYNPNDVALAEDLARRAAMAIDHARLHQRMNEELAERRRAVAALAVSEARFRAVMEQSPLSTQVFDPSGRTLRVNRAWENLWGITLEHVHGYDILHDPQLEQHGIAPLLRRAAAGEAVTLPAIPYDPNQTLEKPSVHEAPQRWVRAFAYPVKAEDGTVLEVVLVHEDITESVTRGEQLQVAENATRLLADAGEILGGSLDVQVTLRNITKMVVPRIADWCAIDLLDDEGKLERLNVAHHDPDRERFAVELFEKYPPREEAPGPGRVVRTGMPDWMPRIDDAVLQAAAQDARHLELLRGLGLRSYICVPLMARGARLGALTLVQAESDRQYRESDVHLAVDLAHRIAAAVDNAKLYQQLRTEDRRKDEFLATLAHELRNPLAPIRTGLALLNTATDPGMITRTRAIMERQLAHMVRLIDDLLDLSRVTRGKVPLVIETLTLDDVVGTAVEACRPLFDTARVHLKIVLPEPPLSIEGDRTRLAQVLSNLLNNAAKFTPGGGHVELRAARNENGLVIVVQDDGIGIPAGMLGQVFDMFVQADSGDRMHGGLGIGLTLVRGLVELHGGRVHAESEGAGRGSRFVVQLPIAAASERADAAPGVLGHDQSAALKILIVDDNADAAETLRTLLSLDGHDARSASSGDEALEVVATFSPDVAFLDIGMPGMNGYELAQRLRAHPATKNSLLVALTGWGQVEDRRRSAAAGFDHHLTKPVDPDEVTRLLSLQPQTPR